MLHVRYVLDEKIDADHAILLEESRGSVKVKLSPEVFSPQACAALNAASQEFLAGGQWFQLWHGEIVSMESPENPRQGGTVARLHRGPVVHEAS